MCSVTILAHALKSVTFVATRSVAGALNICLFSRRHINVWWEEASFNYCQ